MTCTVNSEWFDCDEQVEFEAEAKNSGIDKATFSDGDDCYSTWTFEGPKEAVEKFVENHFQFTPHHMPFSDLVKCIEVGAVVDGVDMHDESFEY